MSQDFDLFKDYIQAVKTAAADGDVVHTGDEKKTPSTGEWSEVGAHLVGARVTAPRAELLRRKLPEIR